MKVVAIKLSQNQTISGFIFDKNCKYVEKPHVGLRVLMDVFQVSRDRMKNMTSFQHSEPGRPFEPAGALSVLFW